MLASTSSVLICGGCSDIFTDRVFMNDCIISAILSSLVCGTGTTPGITCCTGTSCCNWLLRLVMFATGDGFGGVGTGPGTGPLPVSGRRATGPVSDDARAAIWGAVNPALLSVIIWSNVMFFLLFTARPVGGGITLAAPGVGPLPAVE